MKAHLFLPLFFLVGCTTTDDDGYPSLAPREVEKINIYAPPIDPSTPSPPADDLQLSRLNAIEKIAINGNAKFEPLFETAQRQTNAAIGSAPGSESWVVANMAISRAEAATAETASAALEIDNLVDDLLSRASKDPGTPGVNEALATQKRVHAIYQSQQDRLRALNRRLNGG